MEGDSSVSDLSRVRSKAESFGLEKICFPSNVTRFILSCPLQERDRGGRGTVYRCCEGNDIMIVL